MYLEELSKNPSNNEGHITMNILLEFWGKITPCILQLVEYSKVVSEKIVEVLKNMIFFFLNKNLILQLAEMVNLHFLSLLEALLECGSILLSKLLPLWSPILYSHHVQVRQVIKMICFFFLTIFFTKNIDFFIKNLFIISYQDICKFVYKIVEIFHLTKCLNILLRLGENLMRHFYDGYIDCSSKWDK